MSKLFALFVVFIAASTLTPTAFFASTEISEHTPQLNSLLHVSYGNNSIDQPRPAPPPDCPDCVLINPKPGVSAPAEVERMPRSSIGGIAPQNVSGPRGGGDALFWYSPITDYVSGEAWTWLDGGRPSHVACAHVVAFYRGAENVGSSKPPCPLIDGGQMTKGVVSTFATCSTWLQVFTEHSLARNQYYWPASDHEAVGSRC